MNRQDEKFCIGSTYGKTLTRKKTHWFYGAAILIVCGLLERKPKHG